MGKRAFPPLPALYAVLFCCLFTGVLEAQPANDLCLGAEVLAPGSGIPAEAEGSTADGATGDDEDAACGPSDSPESGTASWEPVAPFTPRPAAATSTRA